MWLWVLLGVIGGGCVLLCCGGGIGLTMFGLNVVTTEIEDQLRDNVVLQEHVGEVESFSMDYTRSLSASEEDVFVYQVQGTKGKGIVTVRHITNGANDEEIQSAKLRLPNGQEIDLLPAKAPH